MLSDLKVHQRLAEIEPGLPMRLIGFDTDNGSEMINEAVLRYLRGRTIPVEVSRSRPYHKNDNAHVEQKNRTHIREMLGYERIDRIELVEPLNELQRAWSLLFNLYRPTLKLLRKESRGAKWVKLYEKLPCTPCQRIMNHSLTTEEGKTQLKHLLETNDPLTLWEEVEARLEAFFKLRTRIEEERNSAADLVCAAPVSGGGGIASLRSPIPPPPPTSTAQTKSATPRRTAKRPATTLPRTA